MYNHQSGHSPKHYLAPSTSAKVRTIRILRILSNLNSGFQTSVQRPTYSHPDAFPGPQTRIKAPDNQFPVEIDATANRASRIHNPGFPIHTPQSRELVVTT